MRRFVMWLVVLGVSVGLTTGCGLLGGGGTKEAPKATTAAKAATKAPTK